MKDFFKNILATVFGVFLCIGIFIAFSIISLIGMIASSSSSAETEVKDNSVLVLNLQGQITEQGSDDPFSGLFGDEVQSTGLNDILSAIDKAKENEYIKGIYVETGTIAADAATIQEIRNKLKEFKAKKKWIIAYGENFTQGAYYLASVADKVYINPYGRLDFHGIGAQPMYVKDFMAMFGVKYNIIKVGTYKSATEMYTEDKMSDANREQVSAYINGMWHNMLKDISASRKIGVAELNKIADGFTVMSSTKTLKAQKLVDGMLYADQVKAEVKKILGISSESEINQLSVTAMKNVTVDKDSDNKIAVYYCEGSIVQDALTGFAMGSTTQIVGKNVCKDMEKLAKDDKIKAVVLRINSPGGDAYASEQMWHYISELKKAKPVVVSMGGCAASGGYYMSCNASWIVAQPNTITGSIGIFGAFPDLTGLMTQKLKFHYDEVKTNANATFSPVAMSRPLTADEIAAMQTWINEGYALFRKRVADGRKMPVAKVEELAQGRVWLATDGLKNGLVDQLGGIDDAVKKAAQLAKVKEYSTVDYPAAPDFMVQLLNKVKGGTGSALDENLRLALGSYYEPFMLMRAINEQSPVQARMPYILNMK
ncbi:MAG: signal peptide peptidase SppA [Bacteroidales bacterium]|nr:signal peptide peptidase SppA [Bacteroidales bacterium]MCM1148271.1 signal peptide peptidase SppA [Bacteroidales bacterium]MCM1206594.1 signal peptide peptidase SppA [Bacillota bacterium]MCM1510504.1 signal peptide peptidase SppA [Clostridium sp.]